MSTTDATEPASKELTPVLKLNNDKSEDQDDMCVWIDREHAEQSLIICSDKSANFVFVYTLGGELRQSIAVPKPGNIDIRQSIQLGAEKVDLVVVNQRAEGERLIAFRVNAEKQLEPIHSAEQPMLTGSNYGGCLAHDSRSGRTYFISTSETGTVEQFEILPTAGGLVRTEKVRDIAIGKCEGAVADDLAGHIYITEETRGVWQLSIDPASDVAPTLICRVGQDGLTGDLEGITIARRPGQDDWLLVSDQGRSRVVVFKLNPPHARIGEFSIEGAAETDGIEAITTDLGSSFPHGMFLNHTDVLPRPVLVTPWNSVEQSILAR